MELLKQRILQDGRSLPGGILKVDSFLNHQLDPNLMYKLAEEFARLFADKKINKIVTIEASGIAPAIMLGYQMQLPVVFIKKKQPKTMDFLAYGNAAMGMIDLARQAGATIEGMGFIIEKGFQGGGDKLREAGYNVHSLAIIDSLDNCEISFR